MFDVYVYEFNLYNTIKSVIIISDVYFVFYLNGIKAINYDLNVMLYVSF